MEPLKINNDDILFCQLSFSEYSAIYYQYMQKVDWNPIEDSMTAHYVLAKDSIFGLKHKNIVIATLSAAKSPAFGVAYMGFFIVDKQWRGLNLGKYLWKKTTAVLKQEGYIIEFDSPMELFSYYSSLGYKILSTTTIHRLKDNSGIATSSFNSALQEINQNNIQRVVDYDKSIIPNDNRQEYLYTWVNKKNTVGLCYIENNKVKGYGVMSKYVESASQHTLGYVLAPLYAESPEIAIEIIQTLCKQAKAYEPIYADTLNCSTSAAAIMKSLGFEEKMLVNRMSATGSLDQKRENIISQIYALSSHGYAPL